jgi:hypothetical protein
MFRLSKLQQTPYAPICSYLIPLSAVGQGAQKPSQQRSLTPLFKKQPFVPNGCVNDCEENLRRVWSYE